MRWLSAGRTILSSNLRRLPGPWWDRERNQVIFITSHVHSGSTWLSFVLGTHRLAAHLGEYHRPFEQRGHVACRLCQGKGLPECTMLHGIEEVATSNAYGFALKRYAQEGIHTLVDCSKQLTWLQTVLDAGGGAKGKNITIKVIHLVREPRGWLASYTRRHPERTAEECFEDWQTHIEQTTETLKKFGLAYTSANYDTLCLEPSRTFPELARFTGLSWSSKQLQYWEKEHHGLGGNGAALNNLANTPYANPRTADEGFYRDRLRQSFYDQRWRTHQSADQWDSLCRTSRTDQILAKCKTSLNLIDSQAGSLNQ